MKRALDWPGAVALVTLMTVFSLATAADNMYRWVDADGNVHYSDQPPPADAREAKSLNQERPKSAAAQSGDAGQSPSYVEQEAQFQERREKKTEADAEAKKTADTAAAWDKNCDIARNNLQTLTDPTGGRVRQKNDKGELVWLSHEQVVQQKAQATKDVEKWCKG